MDKKKILSFLLVLMLMFGMLFFLTGCENEEDDDDKKVDSKKVSNEATKIYEEANSDLEEASSKMAKQDIEMFNSTFEKYEGTGKKGSDVKLLFADVISNNEANEDEDGKQVSIEFNGDTLSSSSEITSARNKIATAKTYDVSLEKDSRGLVTTVVVE